MRKPGRPRGSCDASERASTQVRRDDLALLKRMASRKGVYAYDLLHEVLQFYAARHPSALPPPRPDPRQMSFDF